MSNFVLTEPLLRLSSKKLNNESVCDCLFLSKAKFNPSNSKTKFIDLELDSIESNTGRLLNTYCSTDFSSTKNIFTKESVLYGKLRPYLNKFYLPSFEGVCSTEIWVIESDKLDRKYLYYLVQSSYFKFLCKQTCGTKMPRADWKVLSSFPIIYPQKDEQIKIANLLESFDKKINFYIKKRRTMINYYKSLIFHLVNDGITKSSFGEFVIEQKKTGLPASYGNNEGQYPFFINSAIGARKFCDDFKFDGEFLILNTGGEACTNYFDGRFSAMSDCLILKPKSNGVGLYFFLKRNEKRINTVGFRGTGLKHLDIDWLYDLPVVLPKISEEMLKKINEAFTKKLFCLEKQIACLRIYKECLLSDLFPKPIRN